MTKTSKDDTMDTTWKGNISKRVHRIETIFLAATISFIGLLSYTNYSSQIKLQAALSSILEMQQSMSSMSRTQSVLTSQIEMINKEVNQKKQHESEKEDMKSSSKIHRKALSKAKDIPPTRSVTTIQNSFNDADIMPIHGPKKIFRQMQIEQNSTEKTNPCNQTFFRLELQLDRFPADNSFILMNMHTKATIAHHNFSEADLMSDFTFEKCIEDGHYRFVLQDFWGNGIQCLDFFDGLPCYNIYINGILAIPGRNFLSSKSIHEFNTKSLCLIGDELILELKTTHSTARKLTFRLTNSQTREEIKMIRFPDQDKSANKTSFFQCITPSMYYIELFSVFDTSMTCEGPCYTILVNDETVIIGKDLLHDPKHSFFVTTDGIGRELTCNLNPLLSPISERSHFLFDERASKIINVINALSMFTIGSSQYRAACYILYDDPLQLQAEDPRLLQRYALAVLLYSTNDMAEVYLARNVCIENKFGCDEHGQITTVALDNERSKGFIPTEIGHLDQLELLSLASKDLKGTIPTEINKLKNLSFLNLAHNELTGTIPTEFGSLPLEKLYVNDNQLTGNIPSWLGSIETFVTIELDTNLLTGTIPPELFNSRSLKKIALQRNVLVGFIPSEIGKLQNLEMFIAFDNQLEGTIPSEFGKATLLRILHLTQNSLTGTIPNELENIQFQRLYLEDNFLSGTIPNISASELLYLRNNSLTGTIPLSIFNSEMMRLALDNNQLIGEVNQAFCDNLTTLEDFDDVLDLYVDDSTWFLDEPLVTCPCCDDVGCHIWNNDNIIIVGGTRKPSCPASNVFNSDFYERFIVSDNIANVSHFAGLGNGVEGEMDLCLSPTGCFSLKYNIVDSKEDRKKRWDKKYKLGYSSASKSLQEHDTCDSVEVCGVSIGPDHPKRTALNHLTQIALSDLSVLDKPSLPEYKALCWIITQDPMFHDHSVCDGTLLQRYVMVLFYFSFQWSFGFDGLDPVHTCDWPGVECDPLNKYVEHIEISGKSLEGSLVSEIGLLTRLKTLVLSHNSLLGTIDPSIFEYMPDLEVFDVSFNEIVGRVPNTLFQSLRIEEIILSHNLLHGQLPDDIEYSNSIKKFDVENNLFISLIPAAFFACPNLEVINLSRNHFGGTIPSDIGLLQNMREIYLHRNVLSGGIPKEIFNLKHIERFNINSNILVGTIPNEIGMWENATFISLSHNNLKGVIPKELENLDKIEYLHLFHNFLTGLAPNIPRLKELGTSSNDLERYITDCGDPSFLLANPIVCPSCTLCCNSNDMCQENRVWRLSIEKGAFIIVLGVPTILSIIFYLVGYGSKLLHHRMAHWDERDVQRMVDENSTYCLVFSNNYMAWFAYIIVYFLQGCFYFMFLLASSFTSDFSDWQFTFHCSSSSGSCENESSVTAFGWILFFVVTLFTLSVDYINSAQLILKSVAKLSLRLFISGFLHLGMTVLAIFCSFYYNMALATTDTELIVNAVILLFVNDLDEQLMSAMYALAPDWVDERIEEIKHYLTAEGTPTRRRESVLMSLSKKFTRNRKPNVLSSIGMNVSQVDLSPESTFAEHSQEKQGPAIETILVRPQKHSYKS